MYILTFVVIWSVLIVSIGRFQSKTTTQPLFDGVVLSVLYIMGLIGGIELMLALGWG